MASYEYQITGGGELLPDVGLNPAQSFLTRVKIFTLVKSEEEGDNFNQEYRSATTYDIHLMDEDFCSLQLFKQALRDKTGAGFLRSQFFRIAFVPITRSEVFISSSDQLREARQALQLPPWDLYVARYTKVESRKLMDLGPEEADELIWLQERKRGYTRRSTKQHDDPAVDGVARVDIIPQLFYQDSMSEPDLSINEPSDHSYYISESQRPDADGPSSATVDSCVRKILDTSPIAQFYPAETIEQWARMVCGGSHNSFIVPPPHLPFPDATERFGYRNVTIPAHLLGFCYHLAGQLMAKRSDSYDCTRDSDNSFSSGSNTDSHY